MRKVCCRVGSAVVTLSALSLLAAPARSEVPLFGQTKVDERQTDIRAVVTDGEGFLWVLSEAGLCRSDGRTWACPRTDCQGTYLGAALGNVWALCDANTLVQVKGHQLRVVSLPAAMAGGKAKLVGIANHELFLSHSTGTFTWQPGHPPHKLTGHPAFAVARSPSATWLTSARGLLRMEAGQEPKVVFDGPTTSLTLSTQGDAFVRAGDPENGGELLMFTADGALTKARYDTTKSAVLSILLDERNGLLISAERIGLAGYAMQGGPARFIRDMRHGLPHPVVAAQFRDSEGLWLGTLQGLAQLRLNPSIFTVGRPDGMDGDSVFSLTTTPDGAVWMTQGRGLSRYKNGFVHNADAGDGLIHVDLRTVAVTPDGHVWSAGLNNALVHLDLGTNRFAAVALKQQPQNFAIHILRVGPTGTLWMGLVDGGVGKMQDDRYVPLLHGERGKKNRVWDLLEDASGTVWIARRDGTVFAAKNGQHSTYKLAAPSLPLSLWQDSFGHVWVGSLGGGLFRIKQGQVSRLTTQQGLWDDRVLSVIEDGHGWLWMSSIRGVFRVLRSQADAVMDGWAPRVEAIAYQTEDGLRSNEASQGFAPSSARDAQGRLWFAMVGGAAVFDPTALLQSPPPHPVHVTGVQVDGLNVKGPGTAVSAGNGALTFHYAAPALWGASRMRYRVRLVGWDNTWIDQGATTKVAYLGVTPGRFTFEVEANLWDRPDLKTRATWTVQLLAPFYRRGWFAAALALVLFSLAALVMRARGVRQRRWQAALFADRSRIAQDIHDSLEQDLCGMKMQVDAANLWLDKDALQAREHLGRAADLVRDGMVDMRTAVWGLRAGQVRSSELTSGLQQRLARIAQAAQIKLEFSAPGEPTTLPSLVATQIFYIAREAMTNAVKHAHATLITVRLDLRVPGRVILVVEDDGAGMIPQTQAAPRDGGLSGGLGLEGMRVRAAMVHGTLQVTSSPKGTSVAVEIDVRDGPARLT